MKLRHRLSVVAGLVVGSVLTPGVALGHGIGGRGDLPVPLEFFLVGAALALVVSFVGLTVLWPEPRLQTGPLDRPLAARWLGPVASLLAVVGVAPGWGWWWERGSSAICEDGAMWPRCSCGSISGW